SADSTSYRPVSAEPRSAPKDSPAIAQLRWCFGVPSAMGFRQPSLAKGRKTVLVALALASAAAIFAALLARRVEPSYNGHRLSSWVKVISPRNVQNLGPGCTDREAPGAIRSIGTNSLPYLV